MRIEFARSGGFAGMQLQYEVDTELLSAEEAGEWEKLVEQAQFFGLPGSIRPPTSGADRFEYVVDVTRGKQRHRVETADGVVPESLQPLVQRLLAAARQKRG